MKVIICGAGQVGYGIAEHLASEGNDVSVIDTSEDLIQRISDTLDVRGFVGHGAHPDVLRQAGADEADMIIAVTFYDEVNMIACQVAHSLFGVSTKVARIRDGSYRDKQWQKGGSALVLSPPVPTDQRQWHNEKNHRELRANGPSRRAAGQQQITPSPRLDIAHHEP